MGGDALALDAPLAFSVHPWGGASPPLVRTAARAIGERHGFVVRVRDEAGLVGLGEAAPLPAMFPADSLEEARRAFTVASARQRPASLAGADVDVWISTLPEQARSARFALESALSDLRARRRGVRVAEDLTPSPAPHVVQTRLVGALGSEELDLRVAEAARAGYRAIKLKVGPDDLEDAPGRLARVRAMVGPSARVRVDCNGSLAVDDYLALVPALVAAEVELVEEPCAPADLARAIEAPVPVYLDETFLQRSMRALGTPGIAGVVLKASLFDAPTIALRAARLASERGLDVIVSHAFEGPIALAMLRELARVVSSRDPARAHGLDDHAGLGIFDATPPRLTAVHEPARRAGLDVADPTPCLSTELAWTA